MFKQIIRKIFLEDWMLKLLALAITFGLWFGVTGLSTPASKRLTVQLAPSVSNNMGITNDPISEVEIVISGDERRLKNITSSGLIASLDLTAALPGDRVVSLTPENVSVDLPPGVKLDEIQPSRIAVRLEAVEERELPVRANIQGKPAAGFEVYSETVIPQRVRVRGPSTFLKTLEFVSTDKVSIEGKSADFTARQIPIGVSNSKTTVFNTVVDINFKIGEKRIEQVIVVPASASTNERRVRVTLVGTRSDLSKIRPAEVKIEVVKNDAGADIPQVSLPVELRDSIVVKGARFN